MGRTHPSFCRAFVRYHSEPLGVDLARQVSHPLAWHQHAGGRDAARPWRLCRLAAFLGREDRERAETNRLNK